MDERSDRALDRGGGGGEPASGVAACPVKSHTCDVLFELYFHLGLAQAAALPAALALRRATGGIGVVAGGAIAWLVLVTAHSVCSVDKINERAHQEEQAAAKSRQL